MLVIRESKRVGGKIYWECKCECGFKNTISVCAGNLRSGITKSCGCSRIKYHKVGEIVGSVWYRIISGAKKRNLEVLIDIHYISELWKNQNGICVLSGRLLSLPSSNKEYQKFKHTASLDRIDSSIGYIPGNVQWVHKDINFMKNNWPEKELLEMCGNIVGQHLKKEVVLTWNKIKGVK